LLHVSRLLLLVTSHVSFVIREIKNTHSHR
jgi:hypothetical protein